MMLNAGQLMVAVTCPAGWFSYSTYCYYVSDYDEGVSSARSDCLSMNADLVSINDAAENQFVYNIS